MQTNTQLQIDSVLYQSRFFPTALQIDLEVSFASTVTFIIGNVTLDFTKNNEKVKKKIYIALF